MKCRDFSAVLRTFADMLDVAGAPVARDQIVMFAAVFDPHSTSSVADVAKRIGALRGADSSGSPSLTGSPSLGDVARLLSALKSIVGKAGKIALLADIATIEKLLRDRAAMEIGAFALMASAAAAPGRPTGMREAPAVRDDLVVHYKEKLEAALGDEEKFTTVYNDLRADSAIGKPEIVALAKQMMGSAARAEDAALKKIWSRHQSLMMFKAKARATGGRSAA